ncbi:MAG: hypothetical protein CL532_09720 [Aestuariivita sp.]|nr:hypothetical protein [Aestuariivita sp.]
MELNLFRNQIKRWLYLLFVDVKLNPNVAGSVLLVYGCIPVALSNSEGAGSVWVLAQLPGAHLYIQVLGNEKTQRLHGPVT